MGTSSAANGLKETSRDVLVFNPGGNSLKAEIVRCRHGQNAAFHGEKLVSLAIEGIGTKAVLSQFRGKEKIESEPIQAGDYRGAAESLLSWLRDQSNAPSKELNSPTLPALNELACAGIRVVHGGMEFACAVPITSEVEEKIRAFEELAPLHNKNSLEVLEPLRRQLSELPIFAVFDTAFHRTMPDRAALYGIAPDLAGKHGIRRYGFHGISHRFLLERYAHLAGKRLEEINVVTTHLESGCSLTAISRGKSVDNTMGFTPLEGLMMGTRSGDIDPSVVPFLARMERMSVEEVMELLNKRSGLKGVSGISLDTRVLMEAYESDPRAKLAMELFCYRLVKAAGGFLAALGGAEALIFGGGIGENTVLVRERVCQALRFCGVEIDPEANRATIDREGCLSTRGSSMAVWVIPTEEGLEIAHECSIALQQAGQA